MEEKSEVTVRIEEGPKISGGENPPGSIPDSPAARVDTVCWPCVLLGVGFIILGVSYIWMEFSTRK